MSEQLTGLGKRRYKRTFETTTGDVEEETKSKASVEDSKNASNGIDETDKKEDDMNDLRLYARQRYLGQREKKKVEALRQELRLLEEDVNKYGWDNLTQKERDDVSLKRELVELFDKKEADFDEGYQLQEDYVDEKGKFDVSRKEKSA